MVLITVALFFALMSLLMTLAFVMTRLVDKADTQKEKEIKRLVKYGYMYQNKKLYNEKGNLKWNWKGFLKNY